MLSKCVLSLACVVVVSECAGPSSDEPLPTVLADVSADWVNVRAEPSIEAARVGLLERGSQVAVMACTPDCEDPMGWVEVGGGWVRRAQLSMPAQLKPREPDFLHGSVRVSALALKESPDPASKTFRTYSPPRTLAFHDEPDLFATGWLRHVGGGYVPAESVSLSTPSLFQGIAYPSSPTAFVFRDAPVGGPQGERLLAAAQSRFEVTGFDSGRVLTRFGALPRSAVRVASAIARPEMIPPEAKWVHVDTKEQTLTAYEGDRLAYATIVSTGLSDKRTSPGLFQVWMKTRHERMHGEDYFVEEVPDILYFNRSEALHGAFWHDGFGRPRSHGCVNLSPADARWIFDWAPPELPFGWHSILPNAVTGALWVYVT